MKWDNTSTEDIIEQCTRRGISTVIPAGGRSRTDNSRARSHLIPLLNALDLQERGVHAYAMSDEGEVDSEVVVDMSTSRSKRSRDHEETLLSQVVVEKTWAETYAEKLKKDLMASDNTPKYIVYNQHALRNYHRRHIGWGGRRGLSTVFKEASFKNAGQKKGQKNPADFGSTATGPGRQILAGQKNEDLNTGFKNADDFDEGSASNLMIKAAAKNLHNPTGHKVASDYIKGSFPDIAITLNAENKTKHFLDRVAPSICRETFMQGQARLRKLIADCETTGGVAFAVDGERWHTPRDFFDYMEKRFSTIENFTIVMQSAFDKMDKKGASSWSQFHFVHFCARRTKGLQLADMPIIRYEASGSKFASHTASHYCEACDFHYTPRRVAAHELTNKHVKNLAKLKGPQSSSSAAAPPAKKIKKSAVISSQTKPPFPSTLKTSHFPVKTAALPIPVPTLSSGAVKTATTTRQVLSTETIDLSHEDGPSATIDLSVDDDPAPSVAVSRPHRSVPAVRYAEVDDHHDRISIDMDDYDDEEEEGDEDFEADDDDDEDDEDDDDEDDMFKD